MKIKRFHQNIHIKYNEIRRYKIKLKYRDFETNRFIISQKNEFVTFASLTQGWAKLKACNFYPKELTLKPRKTYLCFLPKAYE